MKPFTTLEATACPMPLANIDTDQIIPARFMKRPRSEGGYGQYLFYDFRYDAAGNKQENFALHDPRCANAQIIIAKRNFGCGSSREPAVYALADYGIRCVIAPSFGDIFASNSIRNGVLPAAVSEADADALLHSAHVLAGLPVRIDLAQQTIVAGNLSVGFEIPAQWKARLLNGWDDVDLTKSHASEIAQFAARYQSEAPWAAPRITAG